MVKEQPQRKMRHATRMLLIPEDVYRQLMSMQASPPKQMPDASATALSHMAGRVAQYGAEDGPLATMMGPEERLLHYQQEFKRYSKLLQEERERPAPVNVQQLGAPAAESVAKAIEEANARKQQQQQQPGPVPPKARAKKRKPQYKSSALADDSQYASSGLSSPRQSLSRTASSSTHSDSKSRRTSSSSANTIVRKMKEQSDIDDEDDEDGNETSNLLEQQQQQQPENTAGTSASSAAATVQDPLQQKQWLQESIKYVKQNAEKLGLNGELQVIRLINGEYRPVKNSNAVELLNYHFSLRKPGASGKAPPGYRSFLCAVRTHPYLISRLHPEVHQQQQRSAKKRTAAASATKNMEGEGVRIEIVKKKKIMKSNPIENQQYKTCVPRVHFKPMIW